MRQMVDADIPAIVELGMRMHEGTQYGGWIEAHPQSIANDLAIMLRDPDSAIFVTDDLQGMIGVSLGPEPFGVREIAVERFFYVAPEKRGVGLRLYRMAEEWARSKGAAAMAMIAPSVADDVHALYGRLGYREVERQFVKAL